MSEQIDRSQAGSVVENGLQPDIKGDHAEPTCDGVWGAS